MLQRALKLHKAGLKIIPWSRATDGSTIFPSNYGKYRSEQTEEDIIDLFSPTCTGIALLCTDGIEAIDVDVKHDPTRDIGKLYFSDLKETPYWEEYKNCVIQKTKSNGWHLIYRTNKQEGNKKLAHTHIEGEPEAFLESRGKGGLLFISPTPGYKVMAGDLEAIPFISDKAKEVAFRVAKTFDAKRPKQKAPTPMGLGKTPWEDYDESHNVVDLLHQYGWKELKKSGSFLRMNRPNSKHSNNVDASVIVPKNLFYPFSSSCGFDVNKCYSPSAVYAHYEHSGNYSAAAKELYKMGFGDRATYTAPERPKSKIITPPNIIKPNKFGKCPRGYEKDERGLRIFGKSTEEPIFYDLSNELKVDPACYWVYDALGNTYPISGAGQFGVYTGHEKSGKTFYMRHTAISGLTKKESLGQLVDIHGRPILWADTEQDLYWFQQTQKYILTNAGYTRHPEHYKAVLLEQYDVNDRLRRLEDIAFSMRDIGLFIIDGYVDLIEDYNDLKLSQKVVARLKAWARELNCLLIGVLHLNKGDGKIRGHMGTEIKNKAGFVTNIGQMDDCTFVASRAASRYAPWPEYTFFREDGKAAFTEFDTEQVKSYQFPLPGI